ncbi:MAG: 5-oxoprolinase subunit PxpB [Chloroflexi bacterium]|nr:5-oxoprolinase subunit PxpB [Chloroflexota bacterium]
MIEPYGDEALLITLGESIDEAINDRVHWLSKMIRSRGRADGPFGTPVPAYASLLVPFDPTRVNVETATTEIGSLLMALPALVPTEGSQQPTPIEIGVHYGDADGPDLAAVAEQTGLSPGQVVEAHSSTVYRVFMLGFMPGFAYLGTLPAGISVPRRASPRARVPAGSVAIAERQTAVYPSVTPGGWQIIGWTDAPLWDPNRAPPSLLASGQRVRFLPLTD